MFAGGSLRNGRGLWVLLVLVVVGAVVAGCTSFFKESWVKPNEPPSKIGTGLVSTTTEAAASCVTAILEPERSQLLQEALADSQLQAVRAALEAKGLQANPEEAFALKLGNDVQFSIPFGSEAYLIWNRSGSQTVAYGMIPQGNKTLNITSSGEERVVRILKGNQVTKLLNELRTKNKFDQFEKALHQKGKNISEERIQLLLDESRNHGTLALSTVDAPNGRFTHVLKFHLKAGKDDELEPNEDPAVHESSCQQATSQNELSQVAPSNEQRLANPIPAMEHIPEGGGGGGGSGELCTSSWGYQYLCYSTSPQFNPELATLQPETFVFLSKTSDTSITFWNYGGGTLTGTATIGAPFSIVSGGSYSLTPGKPNTVVVRYNPTAAGSSMGTLHLTKGSSYQDVSITAWTLTLSASTVNFNETFVAVPYDQTLTIQSYAPPVVIETINGYIQQSRNTTVSLSTVAPFSFLGNATTTVTVGSNETKNVTVRFNATAAGTASNTVSLNASYTSLSSSTTVAVTGLAHKITFGSSSLAFVGLVGGTLVQQTVTVTNTGSTTAALTASSSASVFSITSPTSSFTLAPNQSQQVTVRFNPSVSGTSSGNLLLKPGSYASSMALTLSGTAHKVSFEYASLNLSATVNGSYLEQNVLVTNTGTTTVPLVASAAAPFSVTAPTSSFTLIPGQSQQLTVRFSSATAGTFTGAAAVTSGTSSYSIPVTATSNALSLEFTPAQVDFGETFVGNAGVERTVTVKNTTPIVVTLTPSSSAPFSVVSPANSFTLGPLQSQAVVIRYNPTESAISSTNVPFQANNGGTASSSSVPVSGIAHKITANPTLLIFSTVVNSPVERHVILTNVGVTTATFTATAVTPYAIISPTTAFTLTPDATQELIIRFEPTTSGIYQDTVKINNGSSNIGVPASGFAATSEEERTAHYQALAEAQQIVQQENPAAPTFLGRQCSLTLYGFRNQTAEQLETLDRFCTMIRDGDPSVITPVDPAVPQPYGQDDVKQALLFLKDHVQDENFSDWVQQMQQQYPGFNAFVQMLEAAMPGTSLSFVQQLAQMLLDGQPGSIQREFAERIGAVIGDLLARGIISFQGSGSINWLTQRNLAPKVKAGGLITLWLYGLYGAAFGNMTIPGLSQPDAQRFLEASLGFFNSLGVGLFGLPTIPIWVPPGVSLEGQIASITLNFGLSLQVPGSINAPCYPTGPVCAAIFQQIDVNAMTEFFRSVEIANGATVRGWSLVNFMFPIPGTNVRVGVIVTQVFTWNNGADSERHTVFINDYNTFNIDRIVGDVSAISNYIIAQRNNPNAVIPTDGQHMIVLVFNFPLTPQKIEQLKNKLSSASNGLPVVVVDSAEQVTCVVNCAGWTQEALERYAASLGLITPMPRDNTIPDLVAIEDPVFRFELEPAP